ncbi:MAG: transporter substrate-binding domain-containing protein [Puniceicoccaceae bacterium]
MRNGLRILTIFALLLSGELLANQSQTVRVGIFPVEPLNFFDEEGIAQGINPDLLREIVRDQDEWQLEFVPVTWAEGLGKLQAEEIDLMVSVAYTAERTQTMDYNGSPVLEVWGQAFVTRDVFVDHVSSLEGKRIGIMSRDLSGDNFIKLTQAFGINCEIVEYATHEDVFNATQAGEVFAGIAPHHFGLRHAHFHNLKGSPIQFSPFSIYFTTKKGRMQDFLAEIDFHLGRWKQDKKSYYFDRIDYWLNSRYNQRPSVPLWIWLVLCGFGGIAALLFGVNRLLKHQVHARTIELQEKEKNFRLMIETLPLAIYSSSDLSQRGEYMNPAFTSIFGYTIKDVPDAAAWFPLAYPDPAYRKQLEDEWTIRVENAIKSKSQIEPMEVVVTCKDGSSKHVLWGYIAMGEKNYAYGLDLSQIKEAEDKLKQQQYYLEKAQELGHIGSWEMDFQQDKIYWSEENYRIFGIPPGTDISYQKFLQKVHPNDRELIERKWKESTAGEPYDLEHRLEIDGGIKWVRVKAELKFDDQGAATSALGFTQDITERKQAEVELASQLAELRRWHDVVMGRESRVMEIKKEVNELLARLGESPRYAGGLDD